MGVVDTRKIWREKEMRCALQRALSVDAAVLAPAAECLALPPEEYTKGAP
jgi:hypothetical protein